jgi:hypothetical protein
MREISAESGRSFAFLSHTLDLDEDGVFGGQRFKDRTRDDADKGRLDVHR